MIRPTKKISHFGLKIITVVIVLALTISALLIFHKSSSHTGKDEMISVRKRVSKLVLLPSNEDPTLATVQDTKKLTDSFLKNNAVNGDKILVYVKAKKVYIYRPSLNRIVTIGPLQIDPSISEVKDTRIMILTGNAKPVKSEQISNLLKNNYQSAKINPISEALRQNYPTTVVIDLTDGEKYDLVSNMIEVLGAQRGVLPAGETKPDKIDILIITGLDK